MAKASLFWNSIIDAQMTPFRPDFCHESVKNLSTKPLFEDYGPRVTLGVAMRKTIVSIGFFWCFGSVNKRE